jgi:hypothetical protein
LASLEGTQPVLGSTEAKAVLAFCLAAVKSESEHSEVTIAGL